jgi:hypothetical protein
MRVAVIVGIALAVGALPASARADGLPVVGVDAPPGGIGGDIRYEALPYETDTFVQRLDRSAGKVLTSRVLRGHFEIPVVAYDGSAAGLSADGRALVLISPRQRFPRRRTTFALLRTKDLKLREKIALRGDYSFDALSPRGRWLYLIHYTSPDPLDYEVVALDLHTGRLSSPIVDPREPGEKMNGRPLTRTTSSDGRWAYTLYAGKEHPFVHALDTARRDARCIDLDWLTDRRGFGTLRFALRKGDRNLLVRTPRGDAVAAVNTLTFEAFRPRSARAGSWPKAGASALALLLALGGAAYVIRSRRTSYELTS